MNKNEIYFTPKKTISNGYERWRIQKQVDGQKIVVIAKTRKEAVEKAYAKLDEMQRQKNFSIDVNKITFADFVKYYLYEVIEPSGAIKESTLLIYESYYTNHIKNSNLSKTKLINVNTVSLQAFFNNERYQTLALSYTRQIKLFVSTVLNYAVANDLIAKNYTKNVRLINEKTSTPTEKHKFLTEIEIKNLIKHCDDCGDIRLKTLVILILNSGLRINEALALTVRDVSNQTIVVNKNLTAPKGRIVISTPKTTTSIRNIPINQNLQTVLKRYITHLKEKNLKLGITVNDDSILFQNANLKHCQASQLRKKLNTIYKNCDINTTGFHALRHTFGSILYENGVDIKTISTLLGHKNITVTANIYVHLNEEHKNNAVNLINVK